MPITKEIRIRDPYVVVYNNKYYMYKSENNAVWVHQSTDLENWSTEKTVYTLSADSWGCSDLWAPEVHFYTGRYYMFLSLLGKNGLRGTEISVSDTPDGIFVPLTNAPVTPSDRSCIDGSLYVEDDTPYIVYSADWPHNYCPQKDCYIGEIWAAPLSSDLKERVAPPFLLFRSDESPCSRVHLTELNGKQVRRFGSDAPFIIKLKSGSLYLTWSPFPEDTYIVAAAVSENGIKGPWKHSDTPLFHKNGGHAMFFTDLNGNRKMCLHCPEKPPYERALFLNVAEENQKLKLL